MTDAERIADGLSEAQRKAMCPNDEFWADCHKGKGWAKTIITATKLHSLGLFNERKNLSRLTPLGLQVRQILMDRGRE